MVENANSARLTATTIPPHWPGRPMAKARCVRPGPFNPLCHAPVVMMASPVNEQTMSVSMKVCVIDTSAWRTGSRVCAAAAAMPADPRPDSFEKMPRATPK